jgi:hypothetical protein
MNISDGKMLAAAQRRLKDHLRTRPATSEERQHISAKYAETSMAYQNVANARREKASRCGDLLKWAACDQREAALAAANAAAWTIDTAWASTREELEGRVDYYTRLVAASRSTPLKSSVDFNAQYYRKAK